MIKQLSFIQKIAFGYLLVIGLLVAALFIAENSPPPHTISYILVAIASLAAIIIVSVTFHEINNKAKKLTNWAKQISMGNMNEKPPVENCQNEFCELEVELAEIQSALATVTSVSQQIAIGDLNERLTKRSENDLLVDAINRMANDLSAASDQSIAIIESAAINDSNLWLQNGMAMLNDSLRGQRTPEELAGVTIKVLCGYLNAQVGSLYIRKNNDISGQPLNQPELHLLGTYAFTQRKNLSSIYRFGESLVGQAALEKQPIHLNNVPDDYIKIVSGTGETAPQHILVVPFLFKDVVLGVIEIGILNTLNKDAMQFLQRAVEAIGIAFDSTLRRFELDAALLESQELAKILQVQQDELKQSHRNLEEQKKQLESAQHEREVRTKNLEQAQIALSERAKQLAQASKYKSEFLANMSHELRTPLNSILMLSKMLGEGDSGELTESQAEQCRVIHDSGDDLLNLINEILDLSKIESGQMTTNIEAINLHEILKQNYVRFKDISTEKHIDFQTSLDTSLPDIIQTDLERLQQVLRNFISNAIKFTDHGEVKLIIQPITASIIENIIFSDKFKTRVTAYPSDFICFSVVDSGIGIASDRILAVFEAFQQADGSISRKFGGTGLGLSISRQIAELLGGAIAVESIEGTGSTFSIITPLHINAIDMTTNTQTNEDTATQILTSIEKTETEISTTSNPATLNLASTKPVAVETTTLPDINDDRTLITKETEAILLILETDPTLAKELITQGRQAGFKILYAHSGSEGLRLTESYLPSAILLNTQLSEEDGWTVLRKLKSNDKTKSIPAHIITTEQAENMVQWLASPTKQNTLIQVEVFLNKISKINDKENQSDDIDHKNLHHVATELDRLQGNLSGKNVLLVDDDERNVFTLSLALKNYGLNVITASNGQEALDQLNTEIDIHMVLMDIMMPIMDGYTAIRQIRQISQFQSLPIIALTAKAGRDEAQKCLDAGASDYLSKPVALDQLFSFIWTWVMVRNPQKTEHPEAWAIDELGLD
jgi:signal transduction histidine kinase/CheY-like chemotaxis protein